MYSQCPFSPWAQSIDTMADPVDQVDLLQQQGPPTGPPPDFIPMEQPSTFAVDPGAISFCTFSFTYIWLINGQSFWAYLASLSGETLLRGGVSITEEGVGRISEWI